MKKALPILGVFAALFVLDFVIHGMLLSADYQATAAVWRPESEMMSKMPFGIGVQLAFAAAFVLLICKAAKPGVSYVRQGAKFGFLIGLVLAISMISWYCYLPIPFLLALKWFGVTLAECTVLGVVGGAIAQKTCPSAS